MHFYLDVMQLHAEAAQHRGWQMLLWASVHRCPRAAGCWCEGVSTPPGGAQHPQRHHEARKRATAGWNMIIHIFLFSNLKETYFWFQPLVNAHRRDPTVCHEKALKFYNVFVHKLSYEALRPASFQFISSRLIFNYKTNIISISIYRVTLYDYVSPTRSSTYALSLHSRCKSGLWNRQGYTSTACLKPQKSSRFPKAWPRAFLFFWEPWSLWFFCTRLKRFALSFFLSVLLNKQTALGLLLSIFMLSLLPLYMPLIHESFN